MQHKNNHTQCLGGKMTNSIEIATNLLNTIKTITFTEIAPGMVLTDNFFVMSDFSYECLSTKGDATYLITGKETYKGETEEDAHVQIKISSEGRIYSKLGWNLTFEYHSEEA